MSASKEGEELTSKAKVEPTMVSSQMTRRLQCHAPNLEVTVGKSEKLYRYHSLILASQSDYVDTILSSPAARNEQERGRISFPDITVDTWEKMLKFLSPGVAPTPEELLEIIPFYDKYQFSYGLKRCDQLISNWIPSKNESNLWRYGNLPEEMSREFCQVVSLIWPLNDFPLSKVVATKWAARCLRRFHRIDVEMMQTLLPLVENNESVIKSMVSTYLGRMCKGMSMNEMRDLVRQPDFPELCISMSKQINDIDEQLDRMQVKELYIHGCDDRIHGSYEYKDSIKFVKEYNNEFATTHRGGTMRTFWEKEKGNEIIRVAAMDVFGSVWEIYSQPWTPDSDDDDHEEVGGNGEHLNEEGRSLDKKVLLRWENGIYNSLVPPMSGWKIVDESVDERTKCSITRTYFK